jgi:hypothetical protein
MHGDNVLKPVTNVVIEGNNLIVTLEDGEVEVTNIEAAIDRAIEYFLTHLESNKPETSNNKAHRKQSDINSDNHVQLNYENDSNDNPAGYLVHLFDDQSTPTSTITYPQNYQGLSNAQSR